MKSYVAIEQARFGDRLAVKYEIDPALLLCQLPPLIIQPLVENAVRHGLMSREDGGQITITVRQEEETMVIAVTDDGAGIAASKLTGLLQGNKAAGGVGLRNINRRLLNFYGNTLRITSQAGQGTTVVMEIPLKCPENVQNHLP